MDLQQKLTRVFMITFELLMGLGAHYFQHNQGGSGLGLWKITEQKKIVYSRITIIFLIVLGLFILPIFYPNNELGEQSYTRLLGLIAGFIQACYSLPQDYLLPANNIFGYNVGYGRPYGIFQQPNVLASFMATTMILASYLLQRIEDKKLQVLDYARYLYPLDRQLANIDKAKKKTKASSSIAPSTKQARQ